VFTRSGAAWTQQGEKLTGSGESGTICCGGAEFGASVALSPEGNTALIGGPNDNEFHGSAWAFTRSGSTWTQLGPNLIANDGIESGFFGASLALSSDGKTALIGGSGEAWVFVSPVGNPQQDTTARLELHAGPATHRAECGHSWVTSPGCAHFAATLDAGKIGPAPRATNANAFASADTAFALTTQRSFTGDYAHFACGEVDGAPAQPDELALA
jgi:hypothetical protein